MTTKVLSIANLRKTYEDTVAVDGISFEVGPREIVGLLGPNGEDVHTRGKDRAHCAIQRRNGELISINELFPSEGMRR